MYLKRKIDEYLLEWKKNEERLPLIIKGARQIGKTESINHFAEQNYSNIVSINFVLEPKYKTILSDGYAVEDIIKNISMIDTSKRFIAGDTVIIFDELQEFPDIATALKSFRIDGRFDVICSGSLLGINYRKIHSNSVGYKTDYEMFSMDFEEFLWAKGYSEKHIEDILKHMKTRTPFSETELSVYKKLFLEYCVLGGMPAVVKVYIEKNLFTDTLEIQRQIQMDYEEDIRKYGLQLEPDYRAWENPIGGSDNGSFAKVGIPIIWYHTDGHPDYHQPSDHADRLNWDKVVEITKASFLNMWKMANEKSF